MIKSRIWVSVSIAVTRVSLLSPWGGWCPLESKKAGGEAGGLHRPFNLPTEGGVFHRKVMLRGRAFGPPPRKAPSAGATNANDTLHRLSSVRQPLASGTATKRDEPPLLTRIRTLF